MGAHKEALSHRGGGFFVVFGRFARGGQRGELSSYKKGSYLLIFVKGSTENRTERDKSRTFTPITKTT